MILKLSNQQLTAFVSKTAFKNIISTQKYNLLLKSRTQFAFKRCSPQLNPYDSNLVFQTRYNYRSQERFIDFRKDYYQILGISDSAELPQIKQAFYHLAKQYHPDRNKGDDSKFKEINEAYNVLSQPNLKKDYDSNRFKQGSDEVGEGDGTLHDEKAGKGALNYGAYSQLSRLEWAIYRSGYMKHNRTDYSNYGKKFDEEAEDAQLKVKTKRQWDQAFRNMTVEQVKQQMQFREKLHKKHRQDTQAQINARQQYIENRFKEIGNKIERFLGKRIRRLYDRLIEK